MKEHVKILLLGDEGVGKSSLVSFFVSRHFPQEVPPVLTDVTIPPEKTSSNVAVTIMDSSSVYTDRESLRHKLKLCDSILLCYDVTRITTFESLKNHWTPFLQGEFRNEGFMKPVVLVATKADLLDETQKLVTKDVESLFKDYPFILSFQKSSAHHLSEVDDIFRLGEEHITFPQPPVYDIVNKELTPSCYRAFLRIFRIHDLDNDNLLDDFEFAYFYHECFETPLDAEGLVDLKRHIEPGNLRHGYVTFEGLVDVINVHIHRYNFSLPWTILRKFGYDDNLNFEIPSIISTAPRLKPGEIPELTTTARSFLLSLAQNAYHDSARPIHPAEGSSDSSSEVEDQLTWEALQGILAVLPPEMKHPWVEPPAWKVPKKTISEQLNPRERNSSKHSESSLLSDNSENNETKEKRLLLPGFPHVGANLSFDSWLTHWHLLATINPVYTQELLFWLGYVDRYDLGVTPSSGTISQVTRYYESNPFETSPSKSLSLFSYPWQLLKLLGIGGTNLEPRKTIKVCLIGDNGVGKSTLVWALSGLRVSGNEEVERVMDSEKPPDTSIVGGCYKKLHQEKESLRQFPDFTATLNNNPEMTSTINESKKKLSEVLFDPCVLNVSSIPLSHIPMWLEQDSFSCDLVMLLFQCDELDSLDTALRLESLLPKQTPRVFVASKSDLVSAALATTVVGREVTWGDQKHGGEVEMRTSATPGVSSAKILQEYEKVYQSATLHITEHGLPPVQTVSSVSGDGLVEVVNKVLEVVETPDNGVRAEDRVEAKFNMHSRTMWFVSAAVGIATFSALIIYNKEVKQWINQLFPLMVMG